MELSLALRLNHVKENLAIWLPMHLLPAVGMFDEFAQLLPTQPIAIGANPIDNNVVNLVGVDVRLEPTFAILVALAMMCEPRANKVGCCNGSIRGNQREQLVEAAYPPDAIQACNVLF